MADEFLTTRWSMVLAAAGGEGSRANAALEQLCRNSWRPLYAFARRSGRTPEDAEDAVQGFFASLLRGDSLAGLSRDRGRFRTFMLAGLKYHMADESEKRRALKRGGGAAHVPLELENAEERFTGMELAGDSPEIDFDRAWSLELLDRARERLRGECAASDKSALFEALFGGGRAAPRDESYGDLAARLGMNENTLRSSALRLRRRWGELIRAEIADTVNSAEAFEQELESLKESLSV